MDTLSSMQLAADIEGLDAQSKTLLRNTEVLAVILRETVAEYKGYSRKEVIDFIETDSITNTKEVSQGRTNTQVRGDNVEFVQLNEKTSLFDLAFRARNPVLSTETMQISLHVDIESQKTYKPGYPVEKRGLYYLARQLTSQLSLITERTDYSQLGKNYQNIIIINVSLGSCHKSFLQNGSLDLTDTYYNSKMNIEKKPDISYECNC